MSDFELTVRSQLSFGDICWSEFLIDVHARADARPLRLETMQRSGWWKKNVPEVTADEFPVWLADAPPREQQTYALAHGIERPACVLSDDCIIESALGLGTRARKPDGRLLFAPVTLAMPEDVASYEAMPSMGRFLANLDRDGEAESMFIELRRCFMVDARDIGKYQDQLVRHSMTEQARGLLALQWSAYACRRGPKIAEHNADKLSALLGEEFKLDAVRSRDVATTVANVALAAWIFEGSALERAGAAWDARKQVRDSERTEEEAAPDLRDGPTTVSELRQTLESLRDSAQAGLDALDELSN